MKNKYEDQIFDVFNEHYDMCKNDPQTIIMSKADSNLLKSPLFITWEITSNCNLVCKHCRAYENNSKNNYLNDNYYHLDNYKQIIKNLAENEIYTIGITGGEPFLHPYIFEILAEIKQYNIPIILYTNGTLLTDNVVSLLAQIFSEEDILHLSLDGGDEYSNDLQRGNGTFKKILTSLSILKKTDIKIRLNIVPTIFNILSIEKICEIAIENEVFEFGASPLMTIGRAKHINLKPNAKLLYDIELKVVELLKNSQVKYIGGISGNISSLLEIVDYVNIKNFYVNRKSSNVKICDAGNRKIFIDALGDVYPCSLFAGYSQYICGNIFENSLEKIWNSKIFKPFRKGLNVSKTCFECYLYSICNGGCMALSFSEFNDFSYPDPRCIKSKESKE